MSSRSSPHDPRPGGAEAVRDFENWIGVLIVGGMLLAAVAICFAFPPLMWAITTWCQYWGGCPR